MLDSFAPSFLLCRSLLLPLTMSHYCTATVGCCPSEFLRHMRDNFVSQHLARCLREENKVDANEDTHSTVSLTDAAASVAASLSLSLSLSLLITL